MLHFKPLLQVTQGSYTLRDIGLLLHIGLLSSEVDGKDTHPQANSFRPMNTYQD